MGPRHSTDDNSNIVEQPKVSDFYLACRNGEADTVRRILSQSNYDELNRLESNGSTALHAAVFYSHVEVVRILLHEYGFERHHRNRYNLTAFEEAGNHQIRQLFLRTVDDRFCSTAEDESDYLFMLMSNRDSDDINDQNEMICNSRNKTDAELYQLLMAVMNVATNSASIRDMSIQSLRSFTEDSSNALSFDKCVATLKEFFNIHVQSGHLEYRKVQSLFKDCETEKSIDPLIRIHTLSTPFVNKLASEGKSIYLLLCILLKFPTVKPLAYQGTCYRGLLMSNNTLHMYQTAELHKASKLVLQSFCSTSKMRMSAENFPQPADNLLNVIIEFNFTEPCPTALMLYNNTVDRPALSDYPDEEEILIMPFTIFRVTNINKDNQDRYVISLDYVPAQISYDFLASTDENSNK